MFCFFIKQPFYLWLSIYFGHVYAHGFYLLSLVYSKSVLSLKKLQGFSDLSKDKITEHINTIIKAAKLVDKAIRQISTNYLTNSPLRAQADYQLYSLFGYLIVNHDLNKERFVAYAWKKVYLDLIRNFWSGSGDSKVDRIINDNNKYYESDIDDNNANEIIRQYLKDENDQNNKGNISNLDRLTISLLYKHSEIYDTKKIMDIEHIVPRNCFPKNLDFAIGSVVNMTFMRQFDNRKKQNKTYWQEVDLQNNKSDFFDIKDHKIINHYYYPSRKEMNFVHANKIDIYNYKTFLNNRKEKLVKLIKKVLE